MEKYEILTELLSRFYGGDYQNIKRSTKEDCQSYRIIFGDGISITVNELADRVCLHVSYPDADALALFNDVSKRYVEDKRKNKYERTKERLRLAQEELARLEEELKEECA